MNAEEMITEIKKATVPVHIGIIMDGNRRWAKERKLPDMAGHMEGYKKIREVVGWCHELGIKHVTAYTFSSENFNRPSGEVRYLMELYAKTFRDVADDPETKQFGIRVNAIGSLEKLPQKVRDAIDYAKEKTGVNNRIQVNLAIAYGGRQEMVDAVKAIAQDAKAGKVDPSRIDEKTISNNMYTSDIPDPELIIRTSGEQRLSGFLLWQCTYSELYFIDSYWPAVSKEEFLQAIMSYQNRQRRFGK